MGSHTGRQERDHANDTTGGAEMSSTTVGQQRRGRHDNITATWSHMWEGYWYSYL